MRKKTFCLMCLLVSGCANQPVYKPVTVDVPTPVPCRAPAVSHPVWPVHDLSAQAGFVDQIKALLAENELRQGYEKQLEAALQACQ